MFKKLITILGCLFLFLSIGFSQVVPQYIDPLDNMPILSKDNFGISPIEQRGPEFRKFLAASVKIGVSGASGSGTIVYFDHQKNLAYVASCGHLWNQGTMSVEQGQQKKMTCKIITWYHNDKKLDSPKTYEANVIHYSYISGQDTSLVTFTPDWIPDYFPIGPIDYQYITGKHAHSCGCDHGSEAAHYDIEIIGLSGDLVTKLNSPRPGRSGGGLMDDDGFYVGTCWGTENRDGSGKGYFTPLSAIHKWWSQQKGYEFLLNQKPGGSSIARQIPVFESGILLQFPPEYILIPGR